MRLYYMPNSCALAVHIAALEAGFQPELIKVRKTPQGLALPEGDYGRVNPKKKVPALEVDGEVMTETQVLLQYLSSLAPEKLPLPSPEAGRERWTMLQLLNFITTELHKGFSPLFHPDVSPAHKAALIGALGRNFAILEETLGDKPFLAGYRLTVADIYAWVVTGWVKRFGIDLAPFPQLQAWRKRILERPAVQKALTDEGMPSTDPAMP